MVTFSVVSPGGSSPPVFDALFGEGGAGAEAGGGTGGDKDSGKGGDKGGGKAAVSGGERQLRRQQRLHEHFPVWLRGRGYMSVRRARLLALAMGA